MAGVRSRHTTPTGLQSRLIDAAQAHTPTTFATTTTAGLQSRLTGVARARGGNPQGAVPPPGLTRMGVGGDPASWLACAYVTTPTGLQSRLIDAAQAHTPTTSLPPRQQGSRAD